MLAEKDKEEDEVDVPFLVKEVFYSIYILTPIAKEIMHVPYPFNIPKENQKAV